MTSQPDLRHVEARAYRTFHQDGIVDLFVGLSLLWIGLAWIWLPDIAGLAGVLPAVVAPALLPFRSRIIEARAGYVRWREPRRRWERRNLMILLAAGILLFVVGIGAFAAMESGAEEIELVEWIMPGLLAFLLAVLASGLAVVMAQPRMLGYAAVLAGTGIVAAWAELNPGWPMLGSGAVVTIVGTTLVARFVRSHPRVGAE